MHYTDRFLLFAVTAVACPAATIAAQGSWEQCGGFSWTGSTICQAGWTCMVQNPWYSQCLQTNSGPDPVTSSPPAQPVASSSPPLANTKTSSSKGPTSTSPATGGNGIPYKASITHYGAGDTFGSPNCNTNTAACAFYTWPGFSAAVSENLYGVGPGAGAGPACGTCWKITGQTDSSGNPLSNAGTSVVVMVNNLCPKQGNPLCSQSDLSDTNQYGANVNFDLCSDSGAQAAFFGNNGVGLAIGTAIQVDCSQWSGTIVH
ncbi:uncharacterized protein A1O9_10042 [Exophiala aquamarina CBS 119918]|uniref:CBM1 domain-containing protein n=1 Tax=Exophiala aquamarina CBS 119918 TaxID=1182545 RepID=A0A072P1S3_9EURO|nr:uncharacterized protein A1O9_10042 [Exophiala aquamarina CBS 119918]KEF53642.1 hypothetical protein A1O9_10042 [Exophiala aquamarina CBS 119918]